MKRMTEHNTTEIPYEKMAKDQFFELRDMILKDDPTAIGGGDFKDYNINNTKFRIEVNGYWENELWFNWRVFDLNDIILTGTTYLI